MKVLEKGDRIELQKLKYILTYLFIWLFFLKQQIIYYLLKFLVPLFLMIFFTAYYEFKCKKKQEKMPEIYEYNVRRKSTVGRPKAIQNERNMKKIENQLNFFMFISTMKNSSNTAKSITKIIGTFMSSDKYK